MTMHSTDYQNPLFIVEEGNDEDVRDKAKPRLGEGYKVIHSNSFKFGEGDEERIQHTVHLVHEDAASKLLESGELLSALQEHFEKKDCN